MTTGRELPAVAVVGAGAVGCWYGAMLARAGVPVTMIGRPLHVEAMHAHGLRLTSAGGCSLTRLLGVSHDTAGSAPRFAAAKNACIDWTFRTW